MAEDTDTSRMPETPGAPESPGASASPGDPGAPAPGSPAPGGPQDPQATAAWHDVIAQLDALGEAIGRWTRAAVNDPDNRRRAEELKDHVETMAHKVSTAVDEASDSASKSDVGQAFKEAAEKTGEALKAAGERFTDEVAPRMASAFRGAAEKLHQAAERMERPREEPFAQEPETSTEPEDERVTEARAGGAPVSADESRPDIPESEWDTGE